MVGTVVRANRGPAVRFGPMLRIDDHDRVRLLTLDRPEALNAFNAALYDAGRDALLAAAADDDVAVVVITGEGRAFSAGQDLLEMAELASKHGQGGSEDGSGDDGSAGRTARSTGARTPPASPASSTPSRASPSR